MTNAYAARACLVSHAPSVKLPGFRLRLDVLVAVVTVIR